MSDERRITLLEWAFLSTMNAKSVATALNVSPKTVRNWVRAGKLKADKVHGHLSIDIEDAMTVAGVAEEQKPVVRTDALLAIGLLELVPIETRSTDD